MRKKFLLLFLLLTASVFAQSSEAQRQRYAEEGERALAAHRYDEAARAFEKLRDLSPGIAEIHARLGLIYYQQKNFAVAVPSIRQALKLKPALPNLDLLLAMSLSELGKYDEALAGLQKGYKRTTDAALKRSSGLQLLRVYTGLQQDDKAVEVALELTQAYPKDAEVLYHAGRLFANYAYLTTVKLTEVAPDSVWLALAAGEARESQGEYEAALRSYREALALDPNRTGLHFRIGRVLLAQARQSTGGGDGDAAALKEFEAELQLDPANANAAYEAGEIHRKSARLDRAGDLFAQAVKQYPEFEDALLGWGRTLVAQNKAAEALPLLQKALALNAANEVTWYQLSLAQKSLGNAAEQQKALAEFQRLRAEKARRQELTRKEITRQELDSKPQQ
jgi:tetratricopeptide (TPR) repeat protein